MSAPTSEREPMAASVAQPLATMLFGDETYGQHMHGYWISPREMKPCQ